MKGDERLSRRKFLTATGGTAAAAAVAGCGQGDGNGDGEPTATGDGEGEGENEEEMTDTGDGQEFVYATEAQKAQNAWERYEDNQAPDQEQARTEAFVAIEEARRDDMVMLPLYHNLGERFSYQWVDIPARGTLGSHRQQFQEVTIDTDDENKDENVLRYINSTMSDLDPIRSTDTASGIVVGQMYENLTNYKNGVASQLNEQLATGVDVSDDLLTYTFQIKEGVSFHEGGELTASDFVFSFRRLAESVSSQRANFVLDDLGVEHETETIEQDGEEIERAVPDTLAVEATGEYELEITITDPQPFALDILAYDSFGAIPEGYVGDIEGYEGEISQQELTTDTANGTGPFRLDEWSPDNQARVTRFEDYHGSTADVEAVVFPIIEDDNARQTAYLERNLDVFQIPTPFYKPDAVDASEDDLGRQTGTYGPLENGETVDYLGVSEFATYYVAWNLPQAPRAVRRAVAYVTDHEELVDNIFKGRGEPAFSFTPPGMWPEGTEGYNEFAEAFPYGRNETDLESARQVLEEAGITQDDPYDLELTTYESQTFQEFGRVTRDKLSGTGLNLSLNRTKFNSLIDRGKSGELAFYSLGWAWSWVSPAYGLFGFEPENTDTGTNFNGYYLDWQEYLEE